MRASVTTSAIAAAVIGLTGAIVHTQDVRRPSPAPNLTWETCEDMHAEYAARFEGAPGFGLSRMATGSMVDRSGILDLGRTKYTIASIELVGLLRSETPVVYEAVYHNMPLDSIRSRTRAMTDFERTALASFRGGGDMAIAPPDDSGVLHCMGTLRAKHSCVQCHQTKKDGELLGAFSYTLRPQPQR